MAAGKGLDVVEVSPNTEPPVCKILDYGKYLLEQKKKTQGAKKKQKMTLWLLSSMDSWTVINFEDYLLRTFSIVFSHRLKKEATTQQCEATTQH